MYEHKREFHEADCIFETFHIQIKGRCLFKLPTMTWIWINQNIETIIDTFLPLNCDHNANRP